MSLANRFLTMILTGIENVKKEPAILASYDTAITFALIYPDDARKLMNAMRIQIGTIIHKNPRVIEQEAITLAMLLHDMVEEEDS